jgi:Na+/melibiose symporter-like transporter
VGIAVVAVGGVVASNAWTSWVAVMVPTRIRGRYFGPRNARAALAGTAASVGVGALLDWATARGFEASALSWTSILGATAGLLCSALMNEQHEPAAARSGSASGASPRAVLVALGDRRLRGLLAFQALWSVSTGIAASLYSMHALRALGMGVMGLAVYNTALAASRLSATPWWGKALDQAGPRKVLVLCTMLSGIGSALWVATGPACVWPLAIDALVSGVALGGIELAVFAMPLGIGAPQATPGLVGVLAMVAGLAFGVASVAGGAVMSVVSGHAACEVLHASRALFAVSAMGRVVASLLAARVMSAHSTFPFPFSVPHSSPRPATPP